MKKYTMDDFFAGRILVKAASENEMMELLKACEKRGIKWMSGHKATSWLPPVLAVEIFVGRLAYNSKPICSVEYKDLIESTRYQIIIDCDGDTTTAKMIINGKEVKAAKAKRNPDDPFNWKLAASLAFNRLWGEKKAAYREVKRRAKLGEYVKIVAKRGHWGEFYKNGEIHKVVGFYGPNGETRLSCGGSYAEPNEYVVLEGYKPSK